jgi:glutathione S-transferase
MKLYFSPLACSLASRIALYEAGVETTFIEVDPKTKKATDGHDFLAVNPLGLVPVLVTDAGDVLTENTAILQLVAAMYPDAELAPRDGIGRARMQEWLGFIGTELHKAVYVPLLDKKAPSAVKTYALEKAHPRLEAVARRLGDREYALDRFSIVDAYLFTVLHWSIATPISLKPWPTLKAYQSRLSDRPSVARALSIEKPLYVKELARHAVSWVGDALK